MDTDHKETEISHPLKVLFGASGITKMQLAEYYASMYKYMKQHIESRPISMERFPNGILEAGFYQKEAADYFPDYVHRIKVPLKSKIVKQFISIENPETLTFLVNQANISIHTWLSREGSLTKPDMIIWDLDPNDGDFEKVRECAIIAKEILKKYKIEPFLKTSGSEGVHIAVPIIPDQKFEKTKDFALHVAELMVSAKPDLMTLEMHKDDRGSKVFVDYLRNAYSATAAAPYSVRPKEGAPVAMPVTWEALKLKKVKADTFNINNSLERIRKSGDLWAEFFKKPVDLKSLHFMEKQ
jgi:bifunctional non-homologous end joining protein LigD